MLADGQIEFNLYKYMVLGGFILETRNGDPVGEGLHYAEMGALIGDGNPRVKEIGLRQGAHTWNLQGQYLESGGYSSMDLVMRRKQGVLC